MERGNVMEEITAMEFSGIKAFGILLPSLFRRTEG